MTEDPQSFFRRWRVVILFGVLVVVVLVVVREFVDYRSNSPIVYPHSAVINEMSLASPRARQRLEQYYAKHQRQTVASKHYPWLCNEMQELAAQDGIALVWLPDKTSLACPKSFGVYEKP
jgi:DNA topoisomerase VI subunit B